jgi:hypothetical protein
MYAATTTFQRTPLVIAAGNLVAGPVNATFRDGDRESLLHSYLVLVRQLRGQLREPTITLRGEDIRAIAEHLGASEERVLDDLLDRMGATRAQRKALLAMFAMGALSIVATGSVALDLAPAGVFAQTATDVTPAVAVVDVVTPAVSPVVVGAPAAPVEIVRAAPEVSYPTPELAIATSGAEWELMVSLQQLAQALAVEPPTALPEVATEGVGVADDGSVVAVAAPPVAVAPEEGVGVAEDGSVVASGPLNRPAGLTPAGGPPRTDRGTPWRPWP